MSGIYRIPSFTIRVRNLLQPLAADIRDADIGLACLGANEHFVVPTTRPTQCATHMKHIFGVPVQRIVIITERFIALRYGQFLTDGVTAFMRHPIVKIETHVFFFQHCIGPATDREIIAVSIDWLPPRNRLPPLDHRLRQSVAVVKHYFLHDLTFLWLVSCPSESFDNFFGFGFAVTVAALDIRHRFLPHLFE